MYSAPYTYHIIIIIIIIIIVTIIIVTIIIVTIIIMTVSIIGMIDYDINIISITTIINHTPVHTHLRQHSNFIAVDGFIFLAFR